MQKIIALTVLLFPGLLHAQNCWGERPTGRSVSQTREGTPYTGWFQGRYWVNGREATPPEGSSDPDKPVEKKTEPKQDDTPLTGVVAEKLSQVERASVNGREISVQEVKDALRGEIPKDGSKFRLVVKGKDAERLASDWSTAPELAAYRDKYVLQSFPKSHWQADQYLDGVTFVKPDGTVLARGEYINPRSLAEAIENYDPSKDKPLNPKPDPPKTEEQDMTVVVGFAALLVFVIAANRRQDAAQ